MARSLGGIGTWAEEADREEAERKEAQKKLQQQQEAEEAAAAINVSKQRKKKNPTYSLSEVTTGQHVGPGGRTRSVLDNRGLPFADRNPRPAAGLEPRPIDRRRETLPVPVSRADQAGDWSSAKKAAGVSPDQFPAPERRNDRRGVSSQDGRRSEHPAPPQSQPQEEIKHVRVRSDPFAGARPREEVLAAKSRDKGKDADGVRGGDKVSDIADVEKTRVDDERLSSSSSRSIGTSRPPTPTPTPGGPEVESASVPQKKKVNPFGEARPREALLEERGVDWRKKDFELEHRSVDRPESEKERKLKEEIRQLEQLLRNEEDRDKAVDVTDNVLNREHVDNLRAEVIQKENELQELTVALDDMVRFPQKQVQRPSSQSGRSDHSGKLAPGSEWSDISRGYNPEMLSTLSLSGETTRELDAQRPNFSSRDKDISRGFESGRHGGMIRSFDRPDVRVSGHDRPGSSRSGSGDFPGGYDVNRPGIHPGHTSFTGTSDSGWPHSHQRHNDFSHGNGSERSQSSSGHNNFMRGERTDLRSQRSNISQGYDLDRPSSRSWHNDAQAYDSEWSGPGLRHDDTRVYESEKAGTGIRQRDVRWNESGGRRPNSRGSDTIRSFAPERRVSLRIREDVFKGGSDFAGPSNFAGHNEARKISVFDRLGPPLRVPTRGYDTGRGGSMPGFMDAHKDPSAMDWQFGEEGSSRFRERGSLNTAHERERRESWPGQADNRRGYDTNRGLERSGNDQFPYKVGMYREDVNRGRNYGQKEYYRRGNYTSQDKFEKIRGIHG